MLKYMSIKLQHKKPIMLFNTHVILQISTFYLDNDMYPPQKHCGGSLHGEVGNDVILIGHSCQNQSRNNE